MTAKSQPRLAQQRSMSLQNRVVLVAETAQLARRTLDVRQNERHNT